MSTAAAQQQLTNAAAAAAALRQAMGYQYHCDPAAAAAAYQLAAPGLTPWQLELEVGGEKQQLTVLPEQLQQVWDERFAPVVQDVATLLATQSKAAQVLAASEDVEGLRKEDRAAAVATLLLQEERFRGLATWLVEFLAGNCMWAMLQYLTDVLYGTGASAKALYAARAGSAEQVAPVQAPGAAVVAVGGEEIGVSEASLLGLPILPAAAAAAMEEEAAAAVVLKKSTEGYVTDLDPAMEQWGDVDIGNVASGGTLNGLQSSAPAPAAASILSGTAAATAAAAANMGPESGGIIPGRAFTISQELPTPRQVELPEGCIRAVPRYSSEEWSFSSAGATGGGALLDGAFSGPGPRAAPVTATAADEADAASSQRFVAKWEEVAANDPQTCVAADDDYRADATVLAAAAVADGDHGDGWGLGAAAVDESSDVQASRRLRASLSAGDLPAASYSNSTSSSGAGKFLPAGVEEELMISSSSSKNRRGSSRARERQYSSSTDYWEDSKEAWEHAMGDEAGGNTNLMPLAVGGKLLGPVSTSVARAGGSAAGAPAGASLVPVAGTEWQQQSVSGVTRRRVQGVEVTRASGTDEGVWNSRRQVYHGDCSAAAGAAAAAAASGGGGGGAMGASAAMTHAVAQLFAILLLLALLCIWLVLSGD